MVNVKVIHLSNGEECLPLIVGPVEICHIPGCENHPEDLECKWCGFPTCAAHLVQHNGGAALCWWCTNFWN